MILPFFTASKYDLERLPLERGFYGIVEDYTNSNGVMLSFFRMFTQSINCYAK
jgi:hypothetical protein